MGLLTWSNGDVIYLDAVAVIYSVENVQPYNELLYPIWQSAAAGQIRLVGSELLLLETLVMPIREKDTVLKRAFRHILINSDLELIPISRLILDQAARVRAASSLKTPDAIHAATALSAQCTSFLTNDKGFSRVAGLSIQVLDSILAE